MLKSRKPRINSSKIRVNLIPKNNNKSVFGNEELNEFDLHSKVEYSNILKVKAIVKTISHYKPVIIID